MNVVRLYPYSNSKSSSGNYKFKLGCQEKITKETPTTKEWLELTNQFAHSSDDYKIYEGLLEKRKHVVVKVGSSKQLLDEYEKAKLLSVMKLPIFISFYCVFTCFDTFKTLEKNTQYLCKPNQTGDTISVLVMPFLQEGQLDKYKWTRNNIDVYKSVLKHVICSLLYAFENCFFVHCDTHFGNILLRRTKIQSIEYGDKQTLPVLGIIPIVMDFDRSVIQADKFNCVLVYADVNRVMDLARSEIDVKLNISNDIINRYMRNSTPVTKAVYDELCNYIDSLEIDYVVSEKRLQWI